MNEAGSVERIECDRLILRRWRDDDRASFADLNPDPEVMRHFPSSLTTEESDALVERIHSAFELNFDHTNTPGGREAVTSFTEWDVERAGHSTFESSDASVAISSGVR